MKNIIAACFLVFSAASSVRAGETVLPYHAFGPQAAAFPLIGVEWWQWDPHGESRPCEYPVKVVVYWEQTRERTAGKYPVDQANRKDYRYVGYSKAVGHMERTIKELEEAGLDASSVVCGLARIKEQRTGQGAAGQADAPAGHR